MMAEKQVGRLVDRPLRCLKMPIAMLCLSVGDLGCQ